MKHAVLCIDKLAHGISYSGVSYMQVMLHELCLLLSQTSSFPDDELDLWETHTKYIYEVNVL